MPDIICEIRTASWYWRCIVDGQIHPPQMLRAYFQEDRLIGRACLHHPRITDWPTPSRRTE